MGRGIETALTDDSNANGKRNPNIAYRQRQRQQEEEFKQCLLAIPAPASTGIQAALRDDRNANGRIPICRGDRKTGPSLRCHPGDTVAKSIGNQLELVEYVWSETHRNVGTGIQAVQQCQQVQEFKQRLETMATATGRGIQRVLIDNGNANRYRNSNNAYRRQVRQRVWEFKERSPTMPTPRGRGIQPVLTHNANANGKLNSKSAYRSQLCQQVQGFKHLLSTMATAMGRGLQANVQRQWEEEFKQRFPTTAMLAGTGIQERMV
jgi:hypothetical protein